MTDLSNLVARLEAGEAGLTLDADIAEQALGWEIHWRSDNANQSFPYGIWGDKKKGELGRVPAFTESLDAARSLVPEGFDLSLIVCDGNCVADVSRTGTFDVNENEAPTLALALCIAALKAREA